MTDQLETVHVLALPRIVFGSGAVAEVGPHLRALGVTRAHVVTDRFLVELGLHEPVIASLAAAGVTAEVYAVPVGEPTDASMREAASATVEGGFDGVVGLGGGSAVDTAKVCALVAADGGDVREYVNPPLGAGRAPAGPILPLIAIPTTAGTGSEVTAVSVLDLPDEHVKTGISHPRLRPLIALCDPDLTLGLPREITAASGVDAFLHAAEAYTSIPFDRRPKVADPAARPPYQGSHPLADLWVEKAIALVGEHLLRAVEEGTDRAARAGMMMAATYAGVGFGNAGVHIPHALSYPIAGLKHAWKPPGYPGDGRFVPHGLACAVTAPAAFRLTHDALPDRHRRVAELLTGAAVDADDADALPRALSALMGAIGAPTTISELGYEEADLPAMVDGALKQQRLLACSPLPVGAAEIESVLRATL